MVIGSVLYRYDFSVDNNAEDPTDTLLGVTLDYKLNFAAHMPGQVKKACAKASALRRISRFIPLGLFRLCKAYILLHLVVFLAAIAWSWKRSS